MVKKQYTPEQIVAIMRQAKVAATNGKMTLQTCNKAGTVEQASYRRCKEYGGLNVDWTRRLKELEQGKGKPKRLATNPTLDRGVLADLASGNF